MSFAEALTTGLAPDGGLWIPERVPPLPGPPQGAIAGDFAPTAAWAARHLLEGVAEPAVLEEITHVALDFPAPVVEVEPGRFVLELFHGPTLAFKDVGARFMTHALRALEGDAATRTVLVATSGDTGSAVASAFFGMAGTRVVVLFPEGGVSERQRRQMTTLGGNVQALAVQGTFDDCQRLVKDAFAEEGLREAAGLTSANSINVGRLVPQMLYYVHAAATLGWTRAPVFVVPSGNLGNLTAGLLAGRAGVPAGGFVAATNANRVFPDYLDTGIVELRASVPTASNAMDVGAPSNLERIRWLYGGDVGALRSDVRGRSVDDEETRRTIRDVHARTGYVLDPHGAVGWAAAERVEGGVPTVVLATAHPAKFPEVVEAELGIRVPLPDRLASVMEMPERYARVPASRDVLRDLILEGTPA